MINFIIFLISLISRMVLIVVIVDVLISYFMSPFHPFRETLDRIVSPMLKPIQRVVPSVGMIDFSPLILIILIQVAEYVLIKLLTMFQF